MEEYVNPAMEYNGLTDAEADERLEMYGYNQEEEDEKLNKTHFGVRQVFLSLRFVLMLLCTVFMFLNGELAGGIVMILLLLAYILSGIYVLKRCESGSHSIVHNTKVRVRVVRNSELVMLEAKALVPDDVVLLQAGESVPADLYLLEVNDVWVDEGLFTDDHEPVAKTVGVDSKNQLKQTCAYKGTRIVGGDLVGKVTATGVDTLKYKTFGKSETEECFFTSFENTLGKVVPVFTIIALVLFISTALFNFLNDKSTELVPMLYNMLIPAASFALCILPAETSLLVRLYYINAAKRIQSRHMVMRDLGTLEALNAMTAVCIDKTGVITKNRIEVTEEYSKNPALLANVAILSCELTPKTAYDKALILHAAFQHIDVNELQRNELVQSYPYNENDQIGGNLWVVNGTKLMCIKGTAEKVLPLCNVQHDQLFSLQEKQHSLASLGQQVMCIAYTKVDDESVPESIFELQYTVLGLIAFSNQTRDSIPVAVRNCYRAGVKVVMMTGDSPEVAVAIAKKIGMTDCNVITGEELRDKKQNGEPLDVTGVNIFARIHSGQKPDIVALLRDSGEIVATISDSNADISLLEISDIGIAALQSGSAVQETADLLLGDDDFGNFVDTIKETRQTHSNIKKCISLSLSATLVLSIFGTISLFFSTESLLTPILISIITVLMAPYLLMSFLNNKCDPKPTQRSSGFIGKGVIDKRFIGKSILQAVSLVVFIALSFLLTHELEAPIIRSAILAVFASGMLSMMWVNLSDEMNFFATLLRSKGSGIWESLIVFAVLVAIIYIPYLNTWLGLASLNPLILLLCIALGILSQLWVDLTKKKR